MVTVVVHDVASRPYEVAVIVLVEDAVPTALLGVAIL